MSRFPVCSLLARGALAVELHLPRLDLAWEAYGAVGGPFVRRNDGRLVLDLGDVLSVVEHEHRLDYDLDQANSCTHDHPFQLP